MKVEIFADRVIRAVVGLLFAAALIISAVEAAAYSDYGFYEKEYVKNNVTDPDGIVNMDMESLMTVTGQMMSYLRGGRENLDITAVIDGSEKEMFNAVEKYHMQDVRDIFIRALKIRNLSLLLALALLLMNMLRRGIGKGVARTLETLREGLIFADMALLALALAAAANFERTFYFMHYLFFDNTAWILDPDISRLINMLPEAFFVDMAVRIGVIYILMNLIIFVVTFLSSHCTMISLKFKKRLNGGTYEQG